jgi:hypothetical protein
MTYLLTGKDIGRAMVVPSIFFSIQGSTHSHSNRVFLAHDNIYSRIIHRLKPSRMEIV